MQTKGDALRSFLYAWTAIEILVNKTFGSYEERIFRDLEEGEHPDAWRHYLERVRSVMRGKYRLSDKFALIATLLSPESADVDAAQFSQAKEERDKLTHGQDIHEASLPFPIVQELTRKYLRLHLAQ